METRSANKLTKETLDSVADIGTASDGGYLNQFGGASAPTWFFSPIGLKSKHGRVSLSTVTHATVIQNPLHIDLHAPKGT